MLCSQSSIPLTQILNSCGRCSKVSLVRAARRLEVLAETEEFDGPPFLPGVRRGLSRPSPLSACRSERDGRPRNRLIGPSSYAMNDVC